MKSAYDIIKKPVLTEKSYDQFPARTYTFEVEKTANKIEIKQAVEALYNVTVLEVNTMSVAPKKKSRFTKSGVINGQSSAYKKAIVTLKEGEVIDFYSNI